ncbi:MAG: sigma-70 family RNA polymerase sigma factor [Myxococcales bacterium]|nr:sigma-70 family RNA polymerase sigma factor [Myxococcales bacterium]
MTAPVDPPSRSVGDHQLVEEARAGSQAAFRGLVERYQRKIYGMAFAMLRDSDQAKDVVQDAFIKVYQHLGDFQGASGFYTWLYRIAMNLCIDRTRRAKRIAQVEFEDDAAHDDGGASEVSPHRLGFDPARALDDQEIRGQVLAALDQLSPKHRAVIILREVEGLSYKEIADAMECSQGTVMSRLFHARKKMQEMLRSFVEGDGRGSALSGDRQQ